MERNSKRTKYQIDTIKKMRERIIEITNCRDSKFIADDDLVIQSIRALNHPALRSANRKIDTVPAGGFFACIRFIANDLGYRMEDYMRAGESWVSQENSPLGYVASKLDLLFLGAEPNSTSRTAQNTHKPQKPVISELLAFESESFSGKSLHHVGMGIDLGRLAS